MEVLDKDWLKRAIFGDESTSAAALADMSIIPMVGTVPHGKKYEYLFVSGKGRIANWMDELCRVLTQEQPHATERAWQILMHMKPEPILGSRPGWAEASFVNACLDRHLPIPFMFHLLTASKGVRSIMHIVRRPELKLRLDQPETIEAINRLQDAPGSLLDRENAAHALYLAVAGQETEATEEAKKALSTLHGWHIRGLTGFRGNIRVNSRIPWSAFSDSVFELAFGDTMEWMVRHETLTEENLSATLVAIREYRSLGTKCPKERVDRITTFLQGKLDEIHAQQRSEEERKRWIAMLARLDSWAEHPPTKPEGIRKYLDDLSFARNVLQSYRRRMWWHPEQHDVAQDRLRRWEARADQLREELERLEQASAAQAEREAAEASKRDAEAETFEKWQECIADRCRRIVRVFNGFFGLDIDPEAVLAGEIETFASVESPSPSMKLAQAIQMKPLMAQHLLRDRTWLTIEEGEREAEWTATFSSANLLVWHELGHLIDPAWLKQFFSTIDMASWSDEQRAHATETVIDALAMRLGTMLYVHSASLPLLLKPEDRQHAMLNSHLAMAERVVAYCASQEALAPEWHILLVREIAELEVHRDLYGFADADRTIAEMRTSWRDVITELEWLRQAFVELYRTALQHINVAFLCFRSSLDENES